jgi:hypothetical protein
LALLAGLTLLAALLLLLTGLLSRLRLILAFLLIVLARLIALVVLVVRHSYKSSWWVIPQQFVNPGTRSPFRKKATVPKVSLFIARWLHNWVACRISRLQHCGDGHEFDPRGTRS